MPTLSANMPELGHWYHKDGKPQHWVPKKDGTGDRPTTIADARKMGLLPSVTKILRDTLRSPGLERYFMRTAVEAIVTAPDLPGEGLDAKIERVLNRERQQDQESQKAMGIGTEIHDGIEKALNGHYAELPDHIKPFVENVIIACDEFGKVMATERIVIGKGYAGKLDALFGQNGDLVLADFKTTKKLPTKASRPEHILQTAAYARAISYELPETKITTANLYISTINPGQIAVFTQDNWAKTYNDAFRPLVRVWQWMNNFTP